MAVKSLQNLIEHHPNYPKTHSMKLKFFNHWLSLSEDQRKKAFTDDKQYTQALTDIAAIGSYKDKKDLEKANEEYLSKHANELAHAHEYIKLR